MKSLLKGLIICLILTGLLVESKKKYSKVNKARSHKYLAHKVHHKAHSAAKKVLHKVQHKTHSKVHHKAHHKSHHKAHSKAHSKAHHKAHHKAHSKAHSKRKSDDKRSQQFESNMTNGEANKRLTEETLKAVINHLNSYGKTNLKSEEVFSCLASQDIKNNFGGQTISGRAILDRLHKFTSAPQTENSAKALFDKDTSCKFDGYIPDLLSASNAQKNQKLKDILSEFLFKGDGVSPPVGGDQKAQNQVNNAVNRRRSKRRSRR